MTPASRRRILPVALLAPLAAVPLLALALMEFGPERSFLFAGYLLAWAIAYLVAGVVVARRRPNATAGEVLRRAAGWGFVTVVVAILVLFAVSFAPGPR